LEACLRGIEKNGNRKEEKDIQRRAEDGSEPRIGSGHDEHGREDRHKNEEEKRADGTHLEIRM
jgi:hypothetical protein